MTEPKTIGQLNGNWARMLKAGLVTLPSVLAAMGAGVYFLWSVSVQLEVIKETRFTAEDADHLVDRVEDLLDLHSQHSHPTPLTADRLRRNEGQLADHETRIDTLEKKS